MTNKLHVAAQALLDLSWSELTAFADSIRKPSFNNESKHEQIHEQAERIAKWATTQVDEQDKP